MADTRSTYCPVSVDMSVAYRPICRPIFGKHVDRGISRHIDQASVDISADTRHLARSAKYQLTYRPSLGRYVGRYVDRHSADQCRPSLSAKYRSTIGRYVGLYSAEMLTDTRSIVDVDSRPICRPICRPTGALSTHDRLSLDYRMIHDRHSADS